MTDTTTPADEREAIAAAYDKLNAERYVEFEDFLAGWQARSASQPAPTPHPSQTAAALQQEGIDRARAASQPAQEPIRLARVKGEGEWFNANYRHASGKYVHNNPETFEYRMFYADTARQDRIMELADLYANAVNEDESTDDWQDARAALEREVRKPA
jgi:hypothetical protein